jgi:hypothetical protein
MTPYDTYLLPAELHAALVADRPELLRLLITRLENSALALDALEKPLAALDLTPGSLLGVFKATHDLLVERSANKQSLADLEHLAARRGAALHEITALAARGLAPQD